MRLSDFLTPLEATGKVVYEDGSTNFDPDEEDWYSSSDDSESSRPRVFERTGTDEVNAVNEEGTNASEVNSGNEDRYDGDSDE